MTQSNHGTIRYINHREMERRLIASAASTIGQQGAPRYLDSYLHDWTSYRTNLNHDVIDQMFGRYKDASARLLEFMRMNLTGRDAVYSPSAFDDDTGIDLPDWSSSSSPELSMTQSQQPRSGSEATNLWRVRVEIPRVYLDRVCYK
ncbi:uncharacterized protein LOC141911186 isoform X2 [Tubulanus polymorphus]|uniref:uncharacterized protein LOC141911186 isoform X2 n=1 Tax=Tubulanus polymorphus TaxID=672921 RepID=UPI003DA69668